MYLGLCIATYSFVVLCGFEEEFMLLGSALVTEGGLESK
jgi:hypothetical protein